MELIDLTVDGRGPGKDVWKLYLLGMAEGQEESLLTALKQSAAVNSRLADANCKVAIGVERPQHNATRQAIAEIQQVIGPLVTGMEECQWCWLSEEDGHYHGPYEGLVLAATHLIEDLSSPSCESVQEEGTRKLRAQFETLRRIEELQRLEADIAEVVAQNIRHATSVNQFFKSMGR